MKNFLLLLSFLVPLTACATGETISPNMSLVIPGVGITPGPEWAVDLVLSLETIDEHDHSPGKGVPVNSSGININSDLDFNGNNISTPRSVRFDPQGAPLSGASDIGSVFVSGVDLYYRDVNGNTIRLTQSGSIVGTAGSISGLVAPASASYVPANSTFVWQSAVNTAANMDAGCLIQRNITAGSNGITLCAPVALASNYSLTWPGALPAAQKFMTMDSSGNIAAPWAVDGTSLEISSNTLQIKDSGVTTAKINNGAVTQDKLAALSYTESASSGTFTATTTSFVPVTNLSVTLTTTGRPVMLLLIPDGNTGAGSFITLASGSNQLRLAFFRDSTNIAQTSWLAAVANGKALPGGFSHFDSGASAASHTYSVQVKTDLNSQLEVSNVKLVAYEL